jgi:hypothetical protein
VRNKIVEVSHFVIFILKEEIKFSLNL